MQLQFDLRLFKCRGQEQTSQSCHNMGSLYETVALVADSFIQSYRASEPGSLTR